MVAEVYVHSDNHMVVRCMLQGCKLDAADTAVVSSDILQVKFTAADLQSVLMELSPGSVGSGGGQKRRRAGQSYEALRNYLTDEEWHVLSAGGDNGPKLDVLVAASVALGCRCPTEPSLKLLASLWLMTSTSEEVCVECMPCAPSGCQMIRLCASTRTSGVVSGMTIVSMHAARAMRRLCRRVCR